MKYIIWILILLISSQSYAYDLDNLNWKGAKKNLCSINVQRAIWLSWNPWNAHQWMSLVDKHDNPVIWDVAVVDRHSKLLRWHKMGYMYWHVAIVKDINDWKVLLTDWPYAYTFWVKIENIDWFISENKLIELNAHNIKNTQ